MQMRFTLRCAQCMATSVFTRPAIHVWCTKFARGRESIVEKEQPGRHVVATIDATIAAVEAFVWSDGTYVSTNLDDMLKNETLMFNIKRGNINLLSLFVFCLVPMLFITCKLIMTENWWRK